VKRRARRVTLAAAVLGAGILAAFVVVNWTTVRDHAEAWWFQSSRQTQEILPKPGQLYAGEAVEALKVLANSSGRPVIFDPTRHPTQLKATVIGWWNDKPGDFVLHALQEMGYRLVRQRYPRSTYVVVEYPSEAAYFEEMKVSPRS
jgi:hypothetical protein